LGVAYTCQIISHILAGFGVFLYAKQANIGILRIGLELDNIMTAQETAYAEIERLVKSFKEMPTAQCEDDLDRVRNLEREIVHVDEEIDRRVYILYGLSSDEIRIVEGKG
jgi:hypothetical protein